MSTKLRFRCFEFNFNVVFQRPTDVLELQSQQLSFVNTSSLPVTANFDILSPSLSAAPSQPFHSTPPIKGISNDETEQMDSRGQAFFFLSPQDNHSLTTSTVRYLFVKCYRFSVIRFLSAFSFPSFDNLLFSFLSDHTCSFHS